MKTIKLLSNIMIDGQRAAAGSVVTVPTGVALDLLHRQRAETTQEAEETVDAAPEPLETKAPRKTRRK
jgi:hypothetical protein